MPITLDLPLQGEKPWGTKTNKAFRDLEGAANAIEETVEDLDARFGTAFHIAPTNSGDDTANIVAVIASAISLTPAGTRPNIVFDPGVYRVNAPYRAIDPGGTNIWMYGATIKPVDGVLGFNVFQSDHKFELRGGKIDLNKANTTNPNATYAGAGIYVYSTTNFEGVVIEDVEIVNGWQVGIGLSTQSSGVVNARNVPSCPSTIRKVTFRNVRFGTFIQNVADVKVVECFAYDTLEDAFWDLMTERMSVVNCTAVRAGGHGIVSQYSDGWLAMGNEVLSPSNHGIVAGGGDLPALTPMVNFRIIGNTVRGAAVHGITVDTTRAAALTTVVVTNGQIIGNTVEASGGHGIYLQNASGGVCSENVLINNVTSAIGCNSGDFVIDGNFMVDNGSAIGHYGADAAHGNNKIGPTNLRIRNVDYFGSAAAFAKTTMEFSGTGTPEGNVAAPQGSHYHRTDGAAATTLYLKTTGPVGSPAGLNGWVAVS